MHEQSNFQSYQHPKGKELMTCLELLTLFSSFIIQVLYVS